MEELAKIFKARPTSTLHGETMTLAGAPPAIRDAAYSPEELRNRTQNIILREERSTLSRLDVNSCITVYHMKNYYTRSAITGYTASYTVKTIPPLI